MVKLAPEGLRQLDSTLYNTSLQAAFKKKHKDIKATLTLQYPYRTDIKKEEFSLSETSDISVYLVRDFSSNALLYVTFKGPVRDTTVTFRQFPGFCGAAVIHAAHMDNYSPEIISYMEDLLYLMGYTVLMFSEVATRHIWRLENNVPFDKWITKQGYASCMNLTNCRTDNNVNLYYKQLKFTT